MQLKLSTVLALGSLLLACSGEGLESVSHNNPGIGGSATGGADDGVGGTGGNTLCLPDDDCWTVTGGADGVGGSICLHEDPNCWPSAGGSLPTGGTGTGGCSPDDGCWIATGGASPTGGTAGAGGAICWYDDPSCWYTGGASTGGSPAWVSYFEPAPPQPSEFSCCVIWAHCTQSPLDYRCTEATRKVTDSNRADACDIWLEQVYEPIGYESIPYCL